MTDPIVVRNLNRHFQKKQALVDINLDVPQGSVFGMVGENGAGKTTLINHLLGFLKPQSGSVRIFDRDPVREPADVLARVGYLSEDRALPEWMRIGQYTRYLRNFYSTWDEQLERELIDLFELDESQRIKSLSRGQRARTGLLCALAYRPELLILDEPSSGLDVIVRRDILSSVIRNVVNEGGTVVFSSHLLEEVERISDHLVFINSGRIVLGGPLADVMKNYSAVTVHFDQSMETAPAMEGVLHWTGADREWTAICNGAAAELRSAAEQQGLRVVEDRPATLDEVFMATAGHK